MLLQTRKIKGDIFTSDDVLDIKFTGDSKLLNDMVYTVELVSGPDVTHGGGALTGEYLHYKAVERDADADGDIDYSNSFMSVSQVERGVSVVKVKAQYHTKAVLQSFKVAFEEWQAGLEGITDSEALDAHEAIKPVLPIAEVLTTGLITLTWNEFEDYA